MYSFTVRLAEDTTRPYIWIDRFFRIPVLVDTGADISSWMGSERMLKHWGAVDTGKTIAISGAGGNSIGKLYMMYNFQLGEITYEEFPILVSSINTEKNRFILGASVLYKTRFSIDFNKRILGIFDEKPNKTVVIKKEQYLHEFTSVDKITTTILYVYDGEGIPMRYPNVSLSLLIESVQDRLKFLERIGKTDVKIQCDYTTKRKLLEVIPYTYFYDK